MIWPQVFWTTSRIPKRLVRPSKVKLKFQNCAQDKPLQNLLTFDQFWAWDVTYYFVSANQRWPNEATGGSDGQLCQFAAKASGCPKSRKQLWNADPSTSAAQV